MSYLHARVEKMQFTDDAHIVRHEGLRRLLLLKPMKKHPVLIENVELKVAESEVVALVGASGAGKTTLLRIMAGLESRFAGHVSLDSQPVTKPSRKIQVVFQDNRLLPWFNVRRNIAFAAEDLEKADRVEHVNKWVKKVGLDSRAKAIPKNLSGGEESRVAFARVFIEPPKALLLDEPFRALDAMTKYGLQAELLEFIAENGTTVVFVSHSIDDAVLLSDRVIVLKRDPLAIHQEFVVSQTRPRGREDAGLVSVSTQVYQALNEANARTF
ncbi:MAG: ATP-binding cassette domain-containing protein [Verrucomicrobiales bacterium]|nr:ATP-binding cassette domain-containing protein [Verrucomicrobiales bacterium]